MSLVVIGKNSFLAQNFKSYAAPDSAVFLSHEEALSGTDWIAPAEVVINFAFAPALFKEDYDPDLDIDTKLAKLLKARNIHYIMPSTRMVYGESVHNDHKLYEDDEARPTSPYGKNKLAVEDSLQGILGPEKLTILRMGNIFGFEPGRKTFFGTALESLRNKGKMSFNIGPTSVRDFLPAENFSKALAVIAKACPHGVFNLGSGIATSCGDVTKWILEGYGSGEVEFTSDQERGDFVLDMAKTNAAFELEDITRETIRGACIACGQQLKLER